MKEQKKKISLDELKVQSFVTSLPEDKFNTIKGGESQGENICECGEMNTADNDDTAASVCTCEGDFTCEIGCMG